MHKKNWISLTIIMLLCLCLSGKENGSILFIAGDPSHGSGKHEYPQSCQLLAECLNQAGLGLQAEVSEGWPSGADLDEYSTIVIYSDGLDDHIANGHVPDLVKAIESGTGLVVLHFATEPDAGSDLAAFLDKYLGGRFDKDLSINPLWTLEKPIVLDHEVTSGVELGATEDEWYFHLKFADGIKPVLQGHPGLNLLGDDGPRSGNASVREALSKGEPQTLGWLYESSPGRRAFGFTGGHYHYNWTNSSYRKLVLNGILWTTGMKVPTGGVETAVKEEPRYETIDESIARGDAEDVQRHLRADPSRAQKGKHPSLTPLHQAVLRKRHEIAVLLISAGANLDKADTSRRTPLHLAVERDMPETITILMSSGADPHLRDKAGWTPLHNAAAKNRLEVAKALIAGGADTMILSERGGTALHEAAASGGPDLVNLLLGNGVDPSVVSKNGDTALSVAKGSGNTAAINILEKL